MFLEPMDGSRPYRTLVSSQLAAVALNAIHKEAGAACPAPPQTPGDRRLWDQTARLESWLWDSWICGYGGIAVLLWAGGKLSEQWISFLLLL